jgi:hypothetical protein
MADYQEPEFARGIRIPFQPDRVLSPEVFYRGTPPSCIYYVTAEDEPVRVTFEGLDAIKGCRGEYLPYPSDDSPETGFSSLYIVENSRWLRERQGIVSSRLRNIMGTIKSTHDGVVTPEQARALVEPYIREVSQRRRET